MGQNTHHEDPRQVTARRSDGNRDRVSEAKILELLQGLRKDVRALRNRSDYLTVGDVARELKVHESTVRRIISDGDLPVAKVRGCVRIHRENLDAYVRRMARRRRK